MSVQTLQVMTDEPELNDLLDATRSGEESAFATLVMRVQRRVRQWAGRFISDPDEADDIAQDVMIDLQRKVAQFRGANGVSVTPVRGQKATVIPTHDPKITIIWISEGDAE